jgi:hypothetical protein
VGGTKRNRSHSPESESGQRDWPATSVSFNLYNVTVKLSLWLVS